MVGASTPQKSQPFFQQESESEKLLNSLRPHGLQPVRILCPWNSPGKNTGVGCHFLFQGIFWTQGSNLCLLHCRQILYHLSHQGSLCQQRATINIHQHISVASPGVGASGGSPSSFCSSSLAVGNVPAVANLWITLFCKKLFRTQFLDHLYKKFPALNCFLCRNRKLFSCTWTDRISSVTMLGLCELIESLAAIQNKNGPL